MRRSADFTGTVRRGPGTARCARRTLVVHLAVGPVGDLDGSGPVDVLPGVAGPDGAISAPAIAAPAQSAAVPSDVVTPDAVGSAAVVTDGPRTQAGLVVSKAVGPAVVRAQVKRRLRHLLRDRLAALPTGSRLVVRALPPAAAAPSRVLAEELDDALRGALRTLARTGTRPSR